ncbi:MAG: DUF1016 family protein [Bacteroidales bacterium]|nr:DUF1016 family protein [Bacteroidales bacterium]
MKSITITDKEYREWVKELSVRYHQSQIKAAVKINTEKLLFNYFLGRDIVEMHVEDRWGEGVIMQLSKDLKTEIPDVEGLSKSNIYYCKKFYLLYPQYVTIFQQPVGKNQYPAIFQIPWKHHCLIMDKVKNNTSKALFFVNKTLENGWSSSMLLNWIDTDLYEREGKALSNFTETMPLPDSDLAQEVTKDPYNFAFAGVRGRYNESLLKKALLTNITDFLIELGTGFAYVGREYRLQIGETENFIDLLFYHLKLRCYVVVEVKTDKFSPKDIGQLSTYVVACNHLVKNPEDNPTIGLLICKSKDNTIAQYALEGSTQPIGISEYELEKLYPKEVEGSIPSIEEIEANLNKS